MGSMGTKYLSNNNHLSQAADMLLKISALLFVLAAVADAAPNDADPVEITLFYEALCPYCSRFILRQLVPTWRKLKDTGILKVKLFAHGNARGYQDGEWWRFRCQHGTRECQLNQLTTCAQMHLTEEQAFSFVNCIEQNPYPNWGSYCVRRAGGSSDQYSIALRLWKVTKDRSKFMIFSLVYLL